MLITVLFWIYRLPKRLNKHLGGYDFTTTTSTRTKFVCADIIISSVLPGFIFDIVVVDDEMEATSRSSLCVQKRNENDSDIWLSFSHSLSLS